MAYEMKEGQGSLFKNDRREKDTHPHATGRALIGGKVYWISAWTKDGAKGKWQSLAFKEADAQKSSKPSAPEAPTFKDDEIPF